MVVIAMDGDGTVAPLGGPLPIYLIQALTREGHHVYAIGNQALVQLAGIPTAYWDKPIGDKTGACRSMKLKHPDADRFIIVDDTPAQYAGFNELMKEGWEYYPPSVFASVAATL